MTTGPIPAFYDPPAPLPPGDPGAVIRTEPLPLPAGVRAWRILYHSRTIDDADIAVSGFVAAPDREPPPGGFPLVTVAHGTTGVNRACAPSLDPAAEFDGHSALGLLRPYLDAGYAVAGTDYQGLGAPGPPAYLVGVSEGRNVLDAARAARAMSELRLSPAVFIRGHSQGGHAAAFAAQIAAAYAPELAVAGVVLSAPAAELELMAAGIALVNHPLPGVAFLVMATYAWSLCYPDAPLDAVLTTAGLATVDLLKQTCGAAMYPPFESQPPRHYIRPLGLVARATWRRAIAENVPGRASLGAPVLVVQGAADPIVPAVTTEIFVHQLTRAGNQATLTLYPGADHMSVLAASQADVLAWMAAALNAPPARPWSSPESAPGR